MYWRVSCNALLSFDWTTSEVVVSSANFHISAGDVSHFQKSKTGNGLTWARNYWMVNEFKWLKWRNTRHYEYNVKVIKQIKVLSTSNASRCGHLRAYIQRKRDEHKLLGNKFNLHGLSPDFWELMHACLLC